MAGKPKLRSKIKLLGRLKYTASSRIFNETGLMCANTTKFIFKTIRLAAQIGGQSIFFRFCAEQIFKIKNENHQSFAKQTAK